MNRLRRLLAGYGVRIRIVALMAALTVVLVLLIGIVVLKIAEHNFLRQKIVFGNQAVASLQSAINTFWSEKEELNQTTSDINHLNKLVFETAKNLHLADLTIVDESMRVIATAKPSLLGSVQKDDRFFDVFASGKTQRNYVGPKGAFGFGQYERLDFYGPLYHHRKPIAAIRFSLSLEDVSASLQGTLNMLYLYTFLDVLLVLMLGSYLLMSFIVRPLDALIDATESITRGELDHPIPVHSNDEIGHLADSLETLRGSLESKDKTVKEQMASLEDLNVKLKRIRDQLIHTDRLAYVGRVTAGVAHEIGNPLGAIYGYLEILRNSFDDPETAKDVIDRIEGEIGRIDAIMKELLSFSRPQKEGRQPVMATDIINECIDNLRTQRVFDHITPEIHAGTDLPLIEAAPGQLKQVFLNLLLNAADAIGGRGRLSIYIESGAFESISPYLPGLGPEPELDSGKTAYTDVDKRGIVFSSRIPYTEGETIITVAIRDYGPGIEAKHLSSIFDPFFTTKGKTKGTGLGLSICQRIVESMGGIIRVQSLPEKGTIVTCYFLPQRKLEETDVQ